MLPDGFEWQLNALWFNNQVVARVNWQPANRCLVELHVGREGYRLHSGPDRETGVRYVEAWVQKWEAELRRAYTAAEVAT